MDKKRKIPANNIVKKSYDAIFQQLPDPIWDILHLPYRVQGILETTPTVVAPISISEMATKVALNPEPER